MSVEISQPRCPICRCQPVTNPSDKTCNECETLLTFVHWRYCEVFDDLAFGGDAYLFQVVLKDLTYEGLRVPDEHQRGKALFLALGFNEQCAAVRWVTG